MMLTPFTGFYKQDSRVRVVSVSYDSVRTEIGYELKRIPDIFARFTRPFQSRQRFTFSN